MLNKSSAKPLFVKPSSAVTDAIASSDAEIMPNPRQIPKISLRHDIHKYRLNPKSRITNPHCTNPTLRSKTLIPASSGESGFVAAEYRATNSAPRTSRMMPHLKRHRLVLVSAGYEAKASLKI